MYDAVTVSVVGAAIARDEERLGAKLWDLDDEVLDAAGDDSVRIMEERDLPVDRVYILYDQFRSGEARGALTIDR